MVRLRSLVILGVLLFAGQPSARAAPAGTSDWPSLNADAAQSNYNAAEKTITSKNVLKVKVRWAASIPDVSYPVVANGRVYLPVISHGKVHVRAVNAVTGKQVSVYPKDALGGIVFNNGNLYLAGHIVQEVDPSTGNKLAQISAKPSVSGGSFLYPVTDNKLLVAGYAGLHPSAANALYAIDPQTNKVLWKLQSSSAESTLGTGRILTQTAKGSELYDETSGRGVALRPNVYSDWFAGSLLAYCVAAIGRGKATLYAVDGTGRIIWKRAIGPSVINPHWPHAVSPTAVYVQTLTPGEGVQSLDPQSGTILWTRSIPNVQRLAEANGVLFVLSYGLGQQVRLLALHAGSGAPIGAILLSPGYQFFNALNGLMVASGMVFLRAVSPHGATQLIALGL